VPRVRLAILEITLSLVMPENECAQHQAAAFLNTFNTFITHIRMIVVGISETQSLNSGLRLAGALPSACAMARKFQMEITAIAYTHSLSLLPLSGHSVPFVELRQSLSSKVAAISPFVDQLMRFVLYFRRADGSEIDIEMALREALANAIIHGNGGASCKSVYVTSRCYMDGEVSITARDQGRGFDSNAILDPTLLENLLFTHGRGIYLMKTLMDEVSFEGGLLCGCERTPTLM